MLTIFADKNSKHRLIAGAQLIDAFQEPRFSDLLKSNNLCDTLIMYLVDYPKLMLERTLTPELTDLLHICLKLCLIHAQYYNVKEANPWKDRLLNFILPYTFDVNPFIRNLTGQILSYYLFPLTWCVENRKFCSADAIKNSKSMNQIVLLNLAKSRLWLPKQVSKEFQFPFPRTSLNWCNYREREIRT
eukprot:UN31006